ncbi:MAG TPA: hypothetical protein VMS17_24865 [Gemmataceae bacterium]|nr:hypothetical protein [Gemmataceae bacterium]
MDSALIVHRLQFAFTISYYYLFPQLTMRLAPLSSSAAPPSSSSANPIWTSNGSTIRSASPAP